jgi:hypothetical protein
MLGAGASRTKLVKMVTLWYECRPWRKASCCLRTQLFSYVAHKQFLMVQALLSNLMEGGLQ